MLRAISLKLSAARTVPQRPASVISTLVLTRQRTPLRAIGVTPFSSYVERQRSSGDHIFNQPQDKEQDEELEEKPEKPKMGVLASWYYQFLRDRSRLAYPEHPIKQVFKEANLRARLDIMQEGVEKSWKEGQFHRITKKLIEIKKAEVLERFIPTKTYLNEVQYIELLRKLDQIPLKINDYELDPRKIRVEVDEEKLKKLISEGVGMEQYKRVESQISDRLQIVNNDDSCFIIPPKKKTKNEPDLKAPSPYPQMSGAFDAKKEPPRVSPTDNATAAAADPQKVSQINNAPVNSAKARPFSSQTTENNQRTSQSGESKERQIFKEELEDMRRKKIKAEVIAAREKEIESYWKARDEAMKQQFAAEKKLFLAFIEQTEKELAEEERSIFTQVPTVDVTRPLFPMEQYEFQSRIDIDDFWQDIAPIPEQRWKEYFAYEKERFVLIRDFLSRWKKLVEMCEEDGDLDPYVLQGRNLQDIQYDMDRKILERKLKREIKNLRPNKDETKLSRLDLDACLPRTRPTHVFGKYELIAPEDKPVEEFKEDPAVTEEKYFQEYYLQIEDLRRKILLDAPELNVVIATLKESRWEGWNDIEQAEFLKNPFNTAAQNPMTEQQAREVLELPEDFTPEQVEEKTAGLMAALKSIQRSKKETGEVPPVSKQPEYGQSYEAYQKQLRDADKGLAPFLEDKVTTARRILIAPPDERPAEKLAKRREANEERRERIRNYCKEFIEKRQEAIDKAAEETKKELQAYAKLYTEKIQQVEKLAPGPKLKSARDIKVAVWTRDPEVWGSIPRSGIYQMYDTGEPEAQK